MRLSPAPIPLSSSYWPTTPTYEACSGTVVGVPGVTPLKKTDLPSPSSSQMPVAPQLGAGLHAHFLSSTARMLCGLSLHGFVHAITITVSSHVHLPAVFGEHCFLGAIHHLCLLCSFCFLLRGHSATEAVAVFSRAIGLVIPLSGAECNSRCQDQCSCSCRDTAQAVQGT